MTTNPSSRQPQDTGDVLRTRALMLRTQRLRLFAVPVSIAIALSGCQSREARDVDYSMAGNLAPLPTRSGALARRGLADGFLTAGEAAAMWRAYDAEADADRAMRKAETINRWKQRAASAMSAQRAETQSGSGLQPASAVDAEGSETPKGPRR